MPFVDKPIQIPAVPPHQCRELGIELPSNPAQLAQRHAFEAPALHQRYDAGGHPGAIRQVSLPPPEAMSERPEAAPGLNVIHRPIMAAAAYPAIT
jgi:hypothetical protein